MKSQKGFPYQNGVCPNKFSGKLQESFSGGGLKLYATERIYKLTEFITNFLTYKFLGIQLETFEKSKTSKIKIFLGP